MICNHTGCQRTTYTGDEVQSNLSSDEGEAGCEPFRLITWKVIHHIYHLHFSKLDSYY